MKITFAKWSFTSLLTKQTRLTFSGTAKRSTESLWTHQFPVSLFWKVTNICHVLFHYFVVKFSCLYNSLLLFTVQWKLVALIFSSKLFPETKILTFKQFISVSYKMCRIDIVDHLHSFTYYKYKNLISFKIYVVLY